MAAITFGLRFVPALLLAGRPLPAPVMQWMGHVPVAVMAAMVGPSLFLDDAERLRGVLDNPTLWAAVPTALVGLVTRNFLVTVLGGVGLMALVRALGG